MTFFVQWFNQQTDSQKTKLSFRANAYFFTAEIHQFPAELGPGNWVLAGASAVSDIFPIDFFLFDSRLRSDNTVSVKKIIKIIHFNLL